MNKNKKVLGISLIVSVIIVLSIFVLVDIKEDKKSFTVEELVISNLSIMAMDNVYATGDCSETIQKIKDQHWNNINKSRYKKGGEMSWYAAGLVLANHYIAKDCDTALEIIDQYLYDFKIADKDSGHSAIRDDIASGMRYAKYLLKG